ncbi:UDENN domain-containing protein [Entamoeba marina]
MEDHWEHALFEGCIVMRNPKQDTVISDDELIQFSFPNSYQVPKNSYRFLYPELPDLNLFPTSFIAVFSTTNGTQFGHTIRTDDYTICIISYYCWETLFKSVLIEAVKCYDDGQVAFEKYLQEISDKEYPNIPINSIFSMRTSIIIEKLLLSQVIIMFNSILCERRIVIVCSNFETLSSFMLSTLQLLSPLTWPHPIVSILPQCYGDIIDLPTPFICGMATQQFLSCGSFSNKIVLVNLDDGTVRSNDSKMILDDAGLFPETIQTYLKDSLKVVQTSKPSEIPLLLQRTFNTYIQKLLQSPETFIMVKS